MKTPLHPIYPALGSILLTPILVVLFLLTTILIAVSYPLIPFLIYWQKRGEYLQELEESKPITPPQ